MKALPKQKDSRAYLALTMIQAIYREEKQLKDLPAGERRNRRQLSVKPLVEAYFTWVRENLPKVPQKSKTWEGFNYSLNQEKYLKVFLDDGEVPMDNNAAEQSIRGFCIGKKNWVMIDTIWMIQTAVFWTACSPGRQACRRTAASLVKMK